MKIKFFFALIGVLLTSGALGGELAKGEIEEIGNTISNEKLFAVKMSTSSTGPCAGKWVRFKEEYFAGNSDGYKFAFSLAATALASGKTVRVHNYSSDECDGATFIGLYK